MKKVITLLFALLVVSLAEAQPKEAWKTAVTLTAYDANGVPIYSGKSFFIDESGIVVAPYTPFVKAVRAEVVDASGKHYAVTRILGASENYGFVRLATEAKGVKFLVPIADSTQAAQVGTKLFVVGYQMNKKEVPVSVTVQKAERYDAAMYYTTSLGGETKYIGCPLINASGKVVAVVGSHAGEALDIRLATALYITANSALSRELRILPMQKALPDDAGEAVKYVTLLDAIDPKTALLAMNDYIATYPEDATGYVMRATRLSALGYYEEASADFVAAQRFAANGSSPDAVHYAYSRCLYATSVRDSTAAAKGWTLKRAYEEATAAQQMNPQPHYLLQQATCLFEMERYSEAYAKYQEVNATELASDETYFATMLALERAGGDTAQIFALLDKVISLQQRPYNQRSATYFFERAQRLVAYGQYRKAVNDYDEFERIIGPRNLNDTFYYMREQAELQAHMYQQALDDIQSAILSTTPERKPYYQTEEALIYLSCGEYESAKTIGNEALATLPNYIPLLRILAVAYGETGNKAKARELLTRAKTLGDDTADELLKKFE